MNKKTRTLVTAGREITERGFTDDEKRSNTSEAAWEEGHNSGSYPCANADSPPADDRTILLLLLPSTNPRSLPPRLLSCTTTTTDLLTYLLTHSLTYLLTYNGAIPVLSLSLSLSHSEVRLPSCSSSPSSPCSCLVTKSNQYAYLSHSVAAPEWFPIESAPPRQIDRYFFVFIINPIGGNSGARRKLDNQHAILLDFIYSSLLSNSLSRSPTPPGTCLRPLFRMDG